MPINLTKRQKNQQHILKLTSILVATGQSKQTKQPKSKPHITRRIVITVPKINKHLPLNRVILTGLKEMQIHLLINRRNSEEVSGR